MCGSTALTPIHMATLEPNVEVKAGKPNIAKLLKPTKYHPNGRIKMGPDGEVEGPKNNVVRKKEKIIRHESGIEIARVEIPVNGGHVKAEGSVWRIALGGPKKYHQKLMADIERQKLTGKTDKTAPELEIEEAREYAEYRKYLAETKQDVAENADFYAWLKKAK